MSVSPPGTSPIGLTSVEAETRLREFGRNQIRPESRTAGLFLFIGQFKSPITLILIAAATVSLFLQDHTDAILIISIVILSGLLGFWQEHAATHAVEKLRAMVETKIRARRDGTEVSIPLDEIVPGDVVLLSAGAIIPGDGRLLVARELFVNEAVLTGETFPVDKLPQPAAGPGEPDLFMGTHVISGSGEAVILQTGQQTRFGKIAESLRLRRPETEFERGARRFGYLLAEVTLLLVLGIFAINVFLHKPVLDSFLFALALAVGLTPQLLPAIITINLAHGARRMAEHKVIVKRLAAIENFGSMNVLCSDKTGTITEGRVAINATIDGRGNPSAKVALYAYLNAVNETGFVNPIDQAIREQPALDCSAWRKLDERPYDFVRKRLSILFSNNDQQIIITKGALREMLDVCSEVEWADGTRCPLGDARKEIDEQWRRFSSQGCRVLGVACRECTTPSINRESETGMLFLGLIVLFDPPKAGMRDTLQRLGALGIQLKVITGDNSLTAAHLAQEIGLDPERILSGRELRTMSNGALLQQAGNIDVFAEIEPSQKERLILALQKSGHVVGYIGDGINDVSALHAADVSLSVEGAVDIAREAADFVLLEHDLNVLVDGVREGRRTFANTLKYEFIATSANFGNMFSMAGASLFLPFLPLLPKQILFINLLTDLPEMTIANDGVDPELTEKPRRWDIGFIRRFMFVFGLISSIFDYLTFGVLFWLHANVEQFRTAWFIESIASAALIVLVVRSRRPFFKSQPSILLGLTTIAVVIFAGLVPLLPFAPLLGFQALPLRLYGLILLIIAGYIATAEVAKHLFYRRNN